METINAKLHLDELANPTNEFTHVSQLDDNETAQCIGAALLLGCRLDELYAGNRHNTQQLIDMAAELVPGPTARGVVVRLDGYESTLHCVPTGSGPLVVADDLVGVFCTRGVAAAIMLRDPVVEEPAPRAEGGA